MAGAIHHFRLLCAVFSKDFERRHLMRTRQPDRTERIEVLLEDKNTVIYEGNDSFDVIVPIELRTTKGRINIHDWKEIS